MPASTTAYDKKTQAMLEEHIYACERSTGNPRHSAVAALNV